MLNFNIYATKICIENLNFLYKKNAFGLDIHEAIEVLWVDEFLHIGISKILEVVSQSDSHILQGELEFNKLQIKNLQEKRHSNIEKILSEKPTIIPQSSSKEIIPYKGNIKPFDLFILSFSLMDPLSVRGVRCCS